MRTPISIKDLEMAMELPAPCNVVSPFIDPMWFFFYESPDERYIIRLYGLDQRPDDDRDVEGGDLFVPREKFLFTGYWVVGCREPEPTPTPTPEPVVERIKTWLFGE
jgi:hypothetical protein